MIDKLYVIAGTNEQYLNFVTRKVTETWPEDTSISMSNFVYVRNREQLMGIRDPKGFFIGTWYENPDIVEILNQLVVSMTDVEKVAKLNQMYIIYNEYQFERYGNRTTYRGTDKVL